MEPTSEVPTARLQSLIDELRFVNESLKVDTIVEEPVLRDLRQALDNLRMKAWTVHELQNARQAQKDTRGITSFMTAERLRRIRSMIDDLCADLERDGRAWAASSIHELETSVLVLRQRLGG